MNQRLSDTQIAIAASQSIAKYGRPNAPATSAMTQYLMWWRDIEGYHYYKYSDTVTSADSSIPWKQVLDVTFWAYRNQMQGTKVW